jgi:hypothetical protein
VAFTDVGVTGFSEVTCAVLGRVARIRSDLITFNTKITHLRDVFGSRHLVPFVA